MYKHEVVSADPGLPFKIVIHQGQESAIVRHWHRALEIDYIIAGWAKYTIAGTELAAAPGDVIVINTNVVHAILAEPLRPARAVTLLLPYDWLRQQIPDYDQWRFAVPIGSQHPGPPSATLKVLQAALLDIDQTENGVHNATIRRLNHLRDIYTVLSLLMTHFAEPDNSANTLATAASLARMSSVITYLTEHANEPLTLPAVADQVHLSVGYLSRDFKKQIGVPLMTYLSQLRLQNAYDLLTNSDLPISTIADQTGFPNEKSFRQRFTKTYGQRPSAYRQNLQRSKIDR